MRPGSAPLFGSRVRNISAPVFAGPILVGGTSTITPGSWAGSPTLTYTLYRNNAAVTAVSGLSLAAAQAYVFLETDAGPDEKWLEIPNGLTASGVFTNTLATAMTDIAVVAASGVGWEGRFVTTSGSLVTAAINQGSAGATQNLTQATPANQPTLNVSDPLFSMRGTLDTAGDQRLRATDPSFYTFVSNGTGMGFFFVAMGRTANATFACDNRQAGTTPRGMGLLTTGVSAHIKHALGNGVVECYSCDSGATFTLNVPHFISGDHQTGQPGADGHIYMDGVLVGSANNTATPSALASTEAITVGGYNGANFGWNGETAMFYLCKGVPTANDRKTAISYANYWYLGRTRISIIGDSNSVGGIGGQTGCWRNGIGTRFRTGSYFDVISVGTSTEVFAAVPPNPRFTNHNGISGSTLATHQAILATEIAAPVSPNVIIISLGTNDTATLTVAQWKASYTAFIDSILAMYPQVKLLFFGVPFLGPTYAARDTLGGQFNDEFENHILPHCVTRGLIRGVDFEFLDLRPVIGSFILGVTYVDQLHYMTATGAAIEAAAWPKLQTLGVA